MFFCKWVDSQPVAIFGSGTDSYHQGHNYLMLFSTFRITRFLRSWGVLGGLIIGATAWQRPPDDTAMVRRIVQSVQAFYATTHPEKTYLRLDKSVYTAGETVWFSACLVAADTHRPDTLSRVLHVELLASGGRVVARRELRLDGGLGYGDLALPDTLRPATYHLRAYTGWMRNAGPDFFFSRRLEVWPPASVNASDATPGALRARAAAARQVAAAIAQAPDVQFFPEGGNLIEGLDNTVAFKATDYAGRGLDVTGEVRDAQNQVVATFRSHHLGMGTFTLTPVAGQRYHAVLAPAGVATSVPLPVARASGYALHVVALASTFLVNVRQQGGSGGPVLLLGQVRGTVAYVGQGEVIGTETFTARIPKSKFPTGIVQFTLFDGQGTPLAERLAFAQNDPALRVTLAPDRASYGPRQPVRLHLTVADAAGQPVAAQLSLAVTDAGAMVPDVETIASHLLLTSELTGYVETPGYYFNKPTSETAQHLDELLLTQGWRRFAWKETLTGTTPAPYYGLERTLGLAGQVTQPNGKPVPASKLIYLQSRPKKIFLNTATDSEGRFLFDGFDNCDTTRLMLQARNARGGRNVVVRLDPGPPVPVRPLPPLPLQAPAALAGALGRSQAQHAAEIKLQFDTTKSIMLGGVTVKGRKAAQIDPRRPYPTGAATVLRMDDIASARSGGTVMQMLQGRVPGVTVTGVEPDMHAQIRGVTSLSGNSGPLYILDGVPVTEDVMNNFPATDVETIEILKGGQAAIFGSRGSGGIIAVYTRRGSPRYNPAQQTSPGVASVRLPGYYCGREFYVPRYDVAKTKREFPDLRRATLYWNPRVRTDATGQTDLKFFTSDATGSFQLSAEGISGTGQPALGNSILRVE